jgi:hypothetical protein
VRVRASVTRERLLEDDRAVVTYDLRAEGGAEWLELRPLLRPDWWPSRARRRASCA